MCTSILKKFLLKEDISTPFSIFVAIRILDPNKNKKAIKTEILTGFFVKFGAKVSTKNLILHEVKRKHHEKCH